MRSIAIFCAALALSLGCEVVIFSQCSAEPSPAVTAGSLAAYVRRCLCTGPARRASRKLLERVVSEPSRPFRRSPLTTVLSQVEFIRVLDCEDRICEFNQEACRVNAYNGKKSLIRSFP